MAEPLTKVEQQAKEEQHDGETKGNDDGEPNDRAGNRVDVHARDEGDQ